MSTLFSNNITNREKSSQWEFWLICLALIASLLLSILSWLELCVEHCAANQDYRLFGLPFAPVGVVFFIILIGLHFLSRRYSFLSQIVGWLIASALGAELMFIAVQKYQIGHWCPVCLSIAASIIFAALVLIIGYLRNLPINDHNRGEMMQKIMKSFATSFSFVVLGFLLAFKGIYKADLQAAAINDIKERIAFGTKNSPVEVYFVSDWFCPSCKKIEPLIEQVYPKIKSKVTFYFIDYPIHKKSLNFSPYNLAFMLNDKSQYFKARAMLLELSEKTESPTDDEIMKLASKQGLKFKELSFVDIKTGLEYFEKIVQKFDLRATPVVIITNPSKNSIVKLEGRDEISEEKILNAVEKLSPSK